MGSALQGLDQLWQVVHRIDARVLGIERNFLTSVSAAALYALKGEGTPDTSQLLDTETRNISVSVPGAHSHGKADLPAVIAYKDEANVFAAMLEVAQGLVFPAAQFSSSDPNTLDDYEEGTWSPVIGGSVGESGQTYANQKGVYIKIGRLVIAWAYALLSAKGTITGTLVCSGLPFQAASTASSPSFWSSCLAQLGSTVTAMVDTRAYIIAGSSKISLTMKTAAATTYTTLVTADIGNTTDCMVAALYLTAT